MTDLMKAQNFEQIVREKVRQVLFDAMPDSQIDAYVQKEFKSFFDEPKDAWGKPNGMKSEFAKMVHKEMMDVMRPQIVDAIESFLKSQVDANEVLDFGQSWKQKFAEDFVEKCAPVIWRSITSDLISSAFANFRNQVTRGY